MGRRVACKGGGVSVKAPNRVPLGQSPLLSGVEEKTALTEQEAIGKCRSRPGSSKGAKNGLQGPSAPFLPQLPSHSKYTSSKEK